MSVFGEEVSVLNEAWVGHGEEYSLTDDTNICLGGHEAIKGLMFT